MNRPRAPPRVSSSAAPAAVSKPPSNVSSSSRKYAATAVRAGSDAGSTDVDGDRRRADQAIGLVEALRQAYALAIGQRVDEAVGQGVGPVVEILLRRDPALGQRRDPPPRVGGIGRDGDESLGLELPQQPAEISGVEVHPLPELPNAAAPAMQLEQQPRRPERPPRPRKDSSSTPTRWDHERLNRRSVATGSSTIL